MKKHTEEKIIIFLMDNLIFIIAIVSRNFFHRFSRLSAKLIFLFLSNSKHQFCWRARARSLLLFLGSILPYFFRFSFSLVGMQMSRAQRLLCDAMRNENTTSLVSGAVSERVSEWVEKHSIRKWVQECRMLLPLPALNGTSLPAIYGRCWRCHCGAVCDYRIMLPFLFLFV